MNFIPETPKKAQIVPYFDDARAIDGWQGQATDKSIKTLEREVREAIHRLGGVVTNFIQGVYVIEKEKRQGYQVTYVLEATDGTMTRGRIDIAALPVKQTYHNYKTLDKRREQSLKMSLYMLAIALNGTWFLQQLSPGYAALMSWLLVDGEHTITQIWSESATMGLLLPPGSSEFIEGNFKEIS